jgi:hypothetical protein
MELGFSITPIVRSICNNNYHNETQLYLQVAKLKALIKFGLHVDSFRINRIKRSESLKIIRSEISNANNSCII